MHGVKGSFKHKNGEKLKGKFKLTATRKNAEKGKKWKPVPWEGIVNDKKVEILQLSAHPTSIEDFEWTKFPKKYEVVKAYIADAIEELISSKSEKE